MCGYDITVACESTLNYTCIPIDIDAYEGVYDCMCACVSEYVYISESV